MEWNIYRRYTEFRHFHQQLQKHLPEVSTFSFPPKKAIGNKVMELYCNILQLHCAEVELLLLYCNCDVLMCRVLKLLRREGKNYKSTLDLSLSVAVVVKGLGLQASRDQSPISHISSQNRNWLASYHSSSKLHLWNAQGQQSLESICIYFREDFHQDPNPSPQTPSYSGL